MANKSKVYGKVVAHHGSYNVRHMLDDRKNLHDGTFGIYAGRKKLIKNGFKSINDACAYIDDKLTKN